MSRQLSKTVSVHLHLLHSVEQISVSNFIYFLFGLAPEYQEKLKLEEQLRATEEMLKYKRKQVQELQLDLQVISIYSSCAEKKGLNNTDNYTTL